MVQPEWSIGNTLLPGAPPPMLSLELREELRQAIAGPAPDDCKRWTARAVAAWISQKLGCPVRVQRGWNYLQRLKHSQQLPRPQHRGGAPVLAAIGPTPEPVQTVDDLVVKGKALNDQKKYAEEVPLLERATQLDPRDADAWAKLGEANMYIPQFRVDDSLIAVDFAVSLDSNNVLAWAVKGYALCFRKRNEEAFAAYDRALALDPYDTSAHTNKAIYLRKVGGEAEEERAMHIRLDAHTAIGLYQGIVIVPSQIVRADLQPPV